MALHNMAERDVQEEPRERNPPRDVVPESPERVAERAAERAENKQTT